MGTRSITHIHDGDLTDEILCTIYRQFDGYPEGLGAELAGVLAPLAIVNGFKKDRPEANGMGCLAAQIVGALKKGVGNVYIYKAGSQDHGEEYTYRIYAKKELSRDWIGDPKDAHRAAGAPYLRVSENNSAGDGEPLFDGPASEFAAWLKEAQ